MKKFKKSQQDFTFAQLPHNRTEVFIDCYKMRWGTILGIGLIVLLFCLPLLCAEIFTDIVGISIYDRMLKAELTETEAIASLNSLRVLVALVDIPCWACLAIGLAGVTRIIRQLAWGEPIFFFSDLKQGIKDSSWRFVAIFAICALLNFVREFCQRWLTDISILAFSPLVLLVFVVLPVALWMLSQSTIYRVGFGKAFSNGVAFYGKTILQTLATVVVACLMWFVTLISAIIVKYVVFALVIVLLVPAYLIFWFLFSSSVFDQYINKTQFPDFYDKGVYRLDTPVK